MGILGCCSPTYLFPDLETVRVSTKQVSLLDPPISVCSSRASFISLHFSAFGFISILVGLRGAHPIVSAGFPSGMILVWSGNIGFPHVWKPAGNPEHLRWTPPLSWATPKSSQDAPGSIGSVYRFSAIRVWNRVAKAGFADADLFTWLNTIFLMGGCKVSRLG